MYKEEVMASLDRQVPPQVEFFLDEDSRKIHLQCDDNLVLARTIDGIRREAVKIVIEPAEELLDEEETVEEKPDFLNFMQVIDRHGLTNIILGDIEGQRVSRLFPSVYQASMLLGGLYRGVPAETLERISKHARQEKSIKPLLDSFDHSAVSISEILPGAMAFPQIQVDAIGNWYRSGLGRLNLSNAALIYPQRNDVVASFSVFEPGSGLEELMGCERFNNQYREIIYDSLTGDSSYLAATKELLAAMSLRMKQGGLLISAGTDRIPDQTARFFGFQSPVIVRDDTGEKAKVYQLNKKLRPAGEKISFYDRHRLAYDEKGRMRVEKLGWNSATEDCK